VPLESTPEPTHLPAASPDLPDVEILADSDDADVIAARAQLLEAQAKLTKASNHWLDRLMLRFVLPIALAVVGPWAAYTFSVDAQEAKEKASEVQDTVVELEELLHQQKKEFKARSALFREIEEQKAAELAAMSKMVTRLDETLKTALVQMAVSRLVSDRGDITERDVVRDVSAQVQLPGLEEADLKRLATQQYERMMEAKARK
jgi:hypothetical protein